MAVTDLQFQQLLNSINDLTRELKQNKNTFGSGGGGGNGTRIGRGGASNGMTADNNRTIAALSENLNELQKSFKSGGRTIADHFATMIKNINPINAALHKLEKSINESADSQSAAYTNAAKRTLAFAKEVGGNAKELQRVSKEFGELTDAVSDMVENQEKYAKDQALFNKKLKRIQDARAKVEDPLTGFTNGKSSVSGPLDKYLRSLSNNPATKISDKAKLGADNLVQSYAGIAETTKTFLKDIGDSVRKATENFEKTVADSLKSLGGAISKDAAKIPEYITSRLKYGFESNQFIDAFRMGLSPTELNQMRAANRDIINGVTGFGKLMDKDATESLRLWSDNAKQVGLIGAEASQFTTDWMRTAYNTGLTFDDGLSKAYIDQAQTIQQVFGGSIQDSAKMVQDYTRQISVLSRFNSATNDEERLAIQKEIGMRLLHTKYMGIDVEYMKQQQQARYNSAFSDIGDRIRSAILGQVAVNSVKKQAGLTDEEARVYSLGASNSGYQLNDSEQQTYQAALVKMAEYDQKRINETNDAMRSDNITGLATVGLRDVVYQKLAPQSGINRRDNTEQGQRAIAEQRSRGNITFDEFLQFAKDGQVDQKDSVGIFANAVMQFSEAVSGFGGLPGSAIMGALGGAATSILGAVIKRKLGGAALDKVLGRGVGSLLGRIGLGGFGAGTPGAGGLFGRIGLGGFGAGAPGVGSVPGTGGGGAPGAGGALRRGVGSLLGRIGLGGFGAGATTGAGTGTAAAGTVAGTSLLTGAAAVTGAGLAGWGIGTGLSKWGQDAYYSDNALYKGISAVTNPLGFGSTAISDFFATRNSDNAIEIMDRVSTTGQYTKDDIASLVKLRQVGNWWVTSEEDEADRQAVIQQLDNMSASVRRRNAAIAAKDRPVSTAGISASSDGAAGIQRDANGNPIPLSPNDPLRELVEINREQLEVSKDTKKEEEERAARHQVVEDQRSKAQQHREYLAAQVTRMF